MTIPVSIGRISGLHIWYCEIPKGNPNIDGNWGCKFSLRVWKSWKGYTLKVIGGDEKVKYIKGVRTQLSTEITYNELFSILREEFNLEVQKVEKV